MTYAFDDTYDDADQSATSAGRAPQPEGALHVVENFAPSIAPSPGDPATAPSGERLVPAGGDERDNRPRPKPGPDDAPRPDRTGTGGGAARRRLGGLDGLRAVAVMAVVLFHLDFSVLPGGFLGVDVFFVISGFLITNLIATEILTDGRLHLRRFYLRRARRLLPTVFVLLAAVTVGAYTIWRDQIPTVRGGVLSSLFYVTNWWLIVRKESYFVETGRPSMLQHLWSLAIEEQFYLVWTIAVVLLAGGVLAARRGMEPARRLRAVVWLAIALALVSTLVMAIYAKAQNLPYGSTSRVYFGSDTHTMGLFVGSALGAWLALRQARRQVNVSRRLLSGWRRLSIAATDLLGLVGLVVVVQQFFGIDEYTPRLYRGGFLMFDLVVMVTILCAVRPGSLFGRVLDVRPVRWIGQRSYSIYLWHWPVCVITRPDQDVQGPTLLINIARLALILGLSTLSYRFIEVPLRNGRFGRGAWRAWRDRAGRARNSWWAFASVAATVVAVLALVSNRVSATPPLDAAAGPPATSHSAGVVAPPKHRVSPSSGASHAGEHSHRPTPAPAHPGQASSHAPSHGSSAAPSPRSSHASGAPKLSISAFGDSVLLGGEDAIRSLVPRFDADAVEGRQASDVLADITRRAQQHRLRPYVLIHVGDNGAISPDQLRSTLQALSDRKRVVLMTVRVPRDWQDVNNTVIRSVARSFPNVRVEDWAVDSSGRSDWLYSDGIHLRPAGELAYAQIVVRAFREK